MFIEQIIGKQLLEDAKKSLTEKQASMKSVKRRRRASKKAILPEERASSKALSLQDRRNLQASKLGELEVQAAEKWEERTKSFEGKFNSREDLLDYLEQYKVTPFSIVNKPNAMLMKTRNCGLTIESTTEFNAVTEACEKYIDNKIEFTASNGIKMAKRYLTREGWGVRYTSKGIPELIIISFRGMWRFQYRGAGKAPAEYGTQSWKVFKKDCKDAGIDLEEIAVPLEEAEKVKKDVPKPYIEVLNKAYVNLTFENVHHVDIHSAHCYYIAEEFPQLKLVIYKYYGLRKDEEIGKKMKQRLVNLSGFSESEFVKYRFSRMAKAAKVGTNARVQGIIEELEAAGRTPLLVNTDGVWYTGDVYSFQDEGDDIGQLNTDHTNCKFRIKSKGAYEYEEKGEYHPCFRGRSALELFKKRKDWQWGDLFKSGAIIKFPYDQDKLKFSIKAEVEEQ